VSRQVRRVAAFTLILFMALFINLNVLQLLRAEDLANDPHNNRLIIREYAIERGPIVVAGQEIVRSTETGDELKYLRVYEQPELYAHVTGYYSFIFQRSGLESVMNEHLTGQPTEVIAQNLTDLLTGRDRKGNTVVLTIDPTVQQEAAAGLDGRQGAAVAIDVTTGAVLAHYSNPSFDPNLLSSHDGRGIRDYWQALGEDPGDPLLDRVRSEHFPPGSGFKIVVLAAALEAGITETTTFPDPEEFDVPLTTADIGNFGGGTCADGDSITLADALRVSCNTTFAALGVQLGAEALFEQATRFGFNRDIPYTLRTVPSVFPQEMDVPSTAQSALGQRDVRWTPLQAAMVAAAVANDGVLVRPNLVHEILDPAGRVIQASQQQPWAEDGFDAQAVSPQTAAVLQDLMVSVVDSGTGTRAAIEGIRVGGKTGTAQVEGQSPTVWFIGFAIDEATGRKVAVAVVLPDAGDDSTGGVVAAPIARAMLEAALGRR